MEPLGTLVERRGDGLHLNRSGGPGEAEEAFVEVSREAATTVLGGDADEVDVRRPGLVRRKEADEEAGQGAVFRVGHQAGRGEVVEEEPRQQVGHRASAPPVVDDRDDPAVVGRAG